jgi:NitT/TauT family transport system ATP-binding protein
MPLYINTIQLKHQLSSMGSKILVLRQHPGKIKMDVEVDLPRPGTDEIRYTPQFRKLARKLREAIE